MAAPATARGAAASPARFCLELQQLANAIGGVRVGTQHRRFRKVLSWHEETLEPAAAQPLHLHQRAGQTTRVSRQRGGVQVGVVLARPGKSELQEDAECRCSDEQQDDRPGDRAAAHDQQGEIEQEQELSHPREHSRHPPYGVSQSHHAQVVISDVADFVREYAQPLRPRRRFPADPIVDGMLILLAAAVLITPGLLTDFAGFLCLVPAFRRLVKRALKGAFERAVREGTVGVTVSFDGMGDPSRQPPMKNVTPPKPPDPGT